MDQQKNNNTNRGPRQQGKRQQFEEKKYFTELVVLRRVAKATTGAKRLRFSAVVICGDKKGKVGIAMGKGLDPQEAMQKATKRAENGLITIPLSVEGKTVPHRVDAQYKAASVMIKPAPIGTGVVAGGAIRKVLEIAGIENVVAKRMGTPNSLTNAYATILALSKLKQVKHGARTEKVSDK